MMQIWHVSTPALVIINTLAWLVIHLGIAYVAAKIPFRFVKPEWLLFRSSFIEHEGRIYDTLFRVSSWKGLLPDGAAWFFGGFAKKKLQATQLEYLRQFIRETCKGELAHWLVLWVAPVFFLWNPAWAGWINVAYAVAANAPCIIVQRYNRPVLQRILVHKLSRKSRNQSTPQDHLPIPVSSI
ncbi:MAG: glycosyl-4,4'-diaponeurosporenoate acyltransferase [Chitinivibrionales bacterium]|nr:glycosyl-4,4'-diaponeurosporenoate acyltransferase [Chitinivibrionales bacterium]